MYRIDNRRFGYKRVSTEPVERMQRTHIIYLQDIIQARGRDETVYEFLAVVGHDSRLFYMDRGNSHI